MTKERFIKAFSFSFCRRKMIHGLDILCNGDNSQKALENLARAKAKILSYGNSRQFTRLSNYELIVSCITTSDNKANLTVEEIAQVTGLPSNYVKNSLHPISLYALTEKQIVYLSNGRGKYACNGHADHTIPICSLPPRRIHHFIRDI